MSESSNPLECAKPIFDAFAAADRELFLVGGAVRELARGIAMVEIDDLDFCTNARPEESLRILKAADLPTYDVGIEFGTVGTVLYSDDEPGYPKDCQITTYRSEEYYRRGSRHPQVSYGDTLAQDLKRRDFSINSIAMNAAGEYVDLEGGLEDLERGVLRVIGDPLETLAEDPLRILRVGRFIAKLGFEAAPALAEACRERAENLRDISRERWLQEMTKLVCGDYADEGLRFLYNVGVMAVILPEVEALVGLHESSDLHHKDVWAHTLQVIMQCPAEPALRWAGLLHDIGKAETREVDVEQGSVTFYGHEEVGARLFDAIAERFRLDNDTTSEVRAIILHHGRIAQYDSAWSDAAVRRLVRELDPYTDSLLQFGRADLTTSIDARRERALAQLDELARRIDELERAEALRPVFPDGFGYALMESFGLKPGPIIGDLKDHIEDRMLDGDLPMGRDADFYIEMLREDPPDVLRDEIAESS